MKDWFAGLEPRERWLVSGTGLLLVFVILYVGVFEPLFKGAAERRARVEQKRDDLAWMLQAADEIGRLGDAGDRQNGNNGSLVVLVDRTSRQFGLDVQRTQPSGQTGVRVTLRSQPFDKLVQWLAALQQQNGLYIDSASFDPGSGTGVVNATLTLQRRG